MSDIEITSSVVTSNPRSHKAGTKMHAGRSHSQKAHHTRHDTSGHDRHVGAPHEATHKTTTDKRSTHGHGVSHESHGNNFSSEHTAATQEHGDQSHGEHSDDPPSDEAGRGGRHKPNMRRLNLNLTDSLYKEIENLAAQEGRTMTEVIRIGLGLIHLAASARRTGGQMAVIDAENNLHRVILPH